MKNLKNMGLMLNLLGTLITFGILFSTTSAVQSRSDLLFTIGFYLWATLPFAVLMILTLYIHRKGLSAAARVAILVTSILIVTASVLIYWVSIYNTESSTSALVFAIIPVYALVAMPVVYGLAWLLMRSFGKSRVVENSPR